MQSQYGRRTMVRKDEVVRCRIDSDLNRALEQYCKEHHTTKSRVIIRSIKETIEYNRKE